MRKLYLTLVVCFFFIAAFAQKDSSFEQLDQVTQDKLEDIASTTDVELDYNTLLDQLNYYREHPLNLNIATRTELEELSLLNPLQIEALLAHIKENGKLIALEELQAIDGFDPETIYRILPYVKISGNNTNSKVTLKRLAEEGKSSLILRYQQVIEPSKGYSPKNYETGDTSRYLGSPAKIYTQYRYRLSNQFSMGITGEKDAGEQFFKGTQPNGFDFYSAHLFYRGNGLLKSFVVGDYVVQYGQGLTLGTGLTFGKSYDVMNVRKNGLGLSPFTSSNENAYMRGAAVSVGKNKITLDLFYSNHKIDANITSKDSLTQEEIVSALETTGYHRTYGELQDKHTLGEELYGGHLQYKSQHLTIGITDYTTLFDENLVKTFHPYNEFEFSGNHNSNAGIDYNYILNNVNFFGEMARSENGAIAYLNGALISLDQRIGISLLQRYYAKDYQNLFSNAFSESTGNENEQGLFLGIVTKPAQGFALSAYYDQFEYPWLRYLVNAPTVGNDYVVQLAYNPTKTFEAYFRIRDKDKPGDITADVHPISNLIEADQTNYRFNIKYKVSKSFTLSNRVEYVTYREGQNNPEKGYLLSQDVGYKPLGSKWSYSVRYMIFNTDSYATIIYEYENDVLYAYSIPFLYNQGSRFYALLHYRIAKNLESWLRYDITMYSNQSSISSGLDLINGNQKSEMSAQVRLQF